ncbi:MAG: hypothetical protein ACE5OR_16890 [bacterium]
MLVKVNYRSPDDRTLQAFEAPTGDAKGGPVGGQESHTALGMAETPTWPP